MACSFADKCPHYNAWWCDINHSSCGAAKKLEASEPAPAPAPVPDSCASEPAEKAKNKKNRKRGGE